jgi:hypothetical protein
MDDTKPTVTNRSSWIAMTSDPAFDPIRASAVAHICGEISQWRSTAEAEGRIRI